LSCFFCPYRVWSLPLRKIITVKVQYGDGILHD
jgi:hypothetical protein